MFLLLLAPRHRSLRVSIYCFVFLGHIVESVPGAASPDRLESAVVFRQDLADNQLTRPSICIFLLMFLHSALFRFSICLLVIVLFRILLQACLVLILFVLALYQVFRKTYFSFLKNIRLFALIFIDSVPHNVYTCLMDKSF